MDTLKLAVQAFEHGMEEAAFELLDVAVTDFEIDKFDVSFEISKLFECRKKAHCSGQCGSCKHKEVVYAR